MPCDSTSANLYPLSLNRKVSPHPKKQKKQQQKTKKTNRVCAKEQKNQHRSNVSTQLSGSHFLFYFYLYFFFPIINILSFPYKIRKCL
jgi:hypothetical protein